MALPSSIPPRPTRLAPNQRPQKQRRPRRRRSVTSKTVRLDADSSGSGSSKTVPLKPAAATRPQTMALELSANLMVTGILMTASVTSLLRLAPLLYEQRAELHQAQANLAVTEERNYRLKADFGRYFDPRLARQVMQEQSAWKAPAQLQVVWIAPEGLQFPGERQPKDKSPDEAVPRSGLSPASD